MQKTEQEIVDLSKCIRAPGINTATGKRRDYEQCDLFDSESFEKKFSEWIRNKRDEK